MSQPSVLEIDVVRLLKKSKGAGHRQLVIPAKPGNSFVLLGQFAIKRDGASWIRTAVNQVPDEYWVSKSRLPGWRSLKDAKKIEREHKGSGVKYTYAEGRMAFPDLLSNPSRTILTGEGGTTPSRFKHIIQTNKGWRRLTPIELERLNGFPDDWTKTNSTGRMITDGKRAFFMGNALVIGLIEKVGKTIASEVKKSA